MCKRDCAKYTLLCVCVLKQSSYALASVNDVLKCSHLLVNQKYKSHSYFICHLTFGHSTIGQFDLQSDNLVRNQSAMNKYM